MGRSGAFRILIVGNFGGASEQSSPVAQRRVHRVDRDDFEELFGRLGVSAQFDVVEGEAETVRFPEFDALHPDWLFDQMSGFERLRALRRRLGNPNTFRAAAEELGMGANPLRPESQEPDRGSRGDAAASGFADAEDAGSLLDAALEATEVRGRDRDRTGTGSEIVDAVLRDLVLPNATPAADPRLPELLATVDDALAELMRRVLRDLRPLESRWRGLQFLVRRLETDSRLQLHVLDASSTELEATLSGVEDPRETALWRSLVDEGVETPGGEPWSLVVLADAIEPESLAAPWIPPFAALCRAAGGLLLCGAGPGWLQAGETRPVSEVLDGALLEGLCLVTPRMLMRMPYGARGGEVERFSFEEVGSPSDLQELCWGSGAFAAAAALGVGFARRGWDLDARDVVEFEGLPAWVHDVDGEPELLPCAERWLTDRDAEELRARGLAALRSVRGRDAVQVGPLLTTDGMPLGWAET